MTEQLAQILEALTPQEQAEVETFASYLVLRRRLREPSWLTDDISSTDLARLALEGGSFDWLNEEPELYSLNDGEEVEWPAAL
jgi:hypothetical protein